MAYLLPNNIKELIYDGGEGEICFAKIKTNKGIKYGIRKNGSGSHPFGLPTKFNKQVWIELPNGVGSYLESFFIKNNEV